MAIRQHEKLYVAVGNNLQEGLATLEWAIKRWSSHPISIVILYANPAVSKDLVNTPFGKLPVTAVNEEKLEPLRKCEEEKTGRRLSKYMAFCGKVKAEIHKIERLDQPIQQVMLELIMKLHITKLVMAISFMRPSSGRSKSAISGSFYLHRNKPDFCDVYILCGGKLLFSREGSQQEEQKEDDEQGELTVERIKLKPGLRVWLGKVLAPGKTTPYPCSSSTHSSSLPSPSPSSNNLEFSESKAQWKMHSQEIEEYFQQLLEENDDNNHVEENGSLCSISPIEPHILSSAKISEEKLDVLRMQIMDAKRMTQLKKDQVKAEGERQAKASWVIGLCNQRAEELEALINEEISTRIDLNKEMEDTKEQIYEAMADIQENKNRLRSLLEIQSELSSKLQVSSLAKSRAEAQLENAANARTDLVRDIEELRKRRGVLQRRIEFCKEKDAIGMAALASKVDEQSRSGCREFSAEEIELATDKFSEHRRLKRGGEWTNVYKGRINHNSVAIKMLNLDMDLSQQVFETKVNLLMNIRHPNIVTLIGFCPELMCFVFEYMQNGCLRDILFSRRKSRTLRWHHRVHIAAEVTSALGFLHLKEPKCITHGSLNPSNILLDNHLVSKLDTYEITPNLTEQIDVQALGILLLQLLCGRNWAGVNQEALLVQVAKQPIFHALDENAGEWPLDLVEEIMEVAVKCMSVDSESEEDARKVISSAAKTLSLVKKKADGVMATEKSQTRESERGGHSIEEEDEDDGESRVPIIFICPIFKGIMLNPHIAADGYSYEFEAIEEWLQTGHDTSPLTKMKLEHRHLTPNHTLRSLIEDWRTQNPDL